MFSLSSAGGDRSTLASGLAVAAQALIWLLLTSFSSSANAYTRFILDVGDTALLHTEIQKYCLGAMFISVPVLDSGLISG